MPTVESLTPAAATPVPPPPPPALARPVPAPPAQATAAATASTDVPIEGYATLVACLGLLCASFLPWASVDVLFFAPETIGGADLYGGLTAFAAVVAGGCTIAYLWAQKQQGLLIATMAASVIAFVVGFVVIADVEEAASSSVDGLFIQSIAVESGLVFVVLSAALMGLFAFALYHRDRKAEQPAGSLAIPVVIPIPVGGADDPDGPDDVWHTETVEADADEGFGDDSLIDVSDADGAGSVSVTESLTSWISDLAD